MQPQVLNKYLTTPSRLPKVYIGRGSPYGNPFRIGVDGTREEVIAKYESYLMQNPELIRKVKENLRGKDLECFCAPKPCHGDILIKIANEGVAP